MAPGPSSLRSERSTLFHAGGREAEIEEVFRRILAPARRSTRWRSPAPPTRTSRWSGRRRCGTTGPSRSGPGIPATQTRPGRALLGLCDWIETDFSAGHLRRLLQSGDLGVEADDEGFTAGPGGAHCSPAPRPAGAAPPTASRSAACASDYEARAADPDAVGRRPRGRAGEGRADGARARTGSPRSSRRFPSRRPTARSRCRRSSTPRSRSSSSTTARKQRARSPRRGGAASTTSASCARWARSRARCPAALRFIRERVQSLQVAPERPRPGHLYACTLPQAGYAGRPHVFVVGLEEGRVFPSAAEDPVLLDAERAGDLAGAAVCRPTGSTKPCTPRWRASPCRVRRASRSAIRAATPASSARPMRPG